MNKLIFTFSIMSLLSCSPKIIPLKGSYPATPIIQYSSNSIVDVWDKIIDFFAQKGLAIKIIDKSSGLIVSDATELTWTFENKEGKPNHPDRWVAIPKVIAPGADRATSPSSVRGEWNVRIKKAGDKTSINVNLVNIEERVVTGSYASSSLTYTRVDGKSTGVFEKMIYEAIK
jgi:hypothetical protein